MNGTSQGNQGGEGEEERKRGRKEEEEEGEKKGEEKGKEKQREIGGTNCDTKRRRVVRGIKKEKKEVEEIGSFERSVEMVGGRRTVIVRKRKETTTKESEGSERRQESKRGVGKIRERTRGGRLGTKSGDETRGNIADIRNTKKRKREVESNSGFETCEQNTKGSEISERELRGSGDNVESRRLYGEGGYQERFPSHGDERRTQKISGFSSGERVLPIRGDGDGKHSVTIHISQTGETSNRICQGQDGDSSSVVCRRFVGNGKVEDRGGGKHGGGIVITEEFGMAHKLGEVGVGSKTNKGVLRDDDRYIGGGTNDKSTISEEEIDKKGGTKVVRGGREGTSISENGCKSSGKMPSNIEGGSNNTNFHKESDEMLAENEQKRVDENKNKIVSEGDGGFIDLVGDPQDMEGGVIGTSTNGYDNGDRCIGLRMGRSGERDRSEGERKMERGMEDETHQRERVEGGGTIGRQSKGEIERKEDSVEDRQQGGDGICESNDRTSTTVSRDSEEDHDEGREDGINNTSGIHSVGGERGGGQVVEEVGVAQLEYIMGFVQEAAKACGTTFGGQIRVMGNKEAGTFQLSLRGRWGGGGEQLDDKLEGREQLGCSSNSIVEEGGSEVERGESGSNSDSSVVARTSMVPRVTGVSGKVVEDQRRRDRPERRDMEMQAEGFRSIQDLWRARRPTWKEVTWRLVEEEKNREVFERSWKTFWYWVWEKEKKDFLEMERVEKERITLEYINDRAKSVKPRNMRKFE